LLNTRPADSFLLIPEFELLSKIETLSSFEISSSLTCFIHDFRCGGKKNMATAHLLANDIAVAGAPQ
jgi:hypothetical protein